LRKTTEFLEETGPGAHGQEDMCKVNSLANEAAKSEAAHPKKKPQLIRVGVLQMVADS
jgi:hypothetical protein